MNRRKRRAELQQIAFGGAQPCLGFEPCNSLTLANGHPQRDRTAAVRDLDGLARLDAAQICARILPKRPNADGCHVLQVAQRADLDHRPPLRLDVLRLRAGLMARSDLRRGQRTVVNAELGDRAAERGVASDLRAAEPVVGVA